MSKTILDSTIQANRYALLQVALNQFGRPFNELDNEEKQQVNNIALRQYSIEDAVLRSPKAVGVVIHKSQVQKQIEELVSRYPSREKFKDELTTNRLEPNEFQNAIERQLRVEETLSMVSLEAEECNETDASLYYYLHPEKFQQQETRVCRHILITVNNKFPENSETNALRRIEKIRSRVLAKPSRFEEQAAKHSECPTAMEKGLIGRIKRGVLYPDLDKAIFSMQEASISEVLCSPMGFHILCCEKIFPAGLIPLKQILPEIQKKLTERNRKAKQKKWLAELLLQNN